MDNVITQELFDFIYKNVLIMLDIQEPDNATKQLITLYINSTCQNIVIKTNRTSFPEGLKYLVIEMVTDWYTVNKSNIDTESTQIVQSMSENGRSVNYTIPDNLKSKINLFIQKQLNEQDTLINRYKLLYRTRCPYEKN